MKLISSQKMTLKAGIACLAISFWTAWLAVTLYPFSGESEVIRLSWYVGLTLGMTTVGIVGMAFAQLSSSVWNMAHAMSLALPLHLLALMAENRELAIICLALSAGPVVANSLIVLREYQVVHLNNR